MAVPIQTERGTRTERAELDAMECGAETGGLGAARLATARILSPCARAYIRPRADAGSSLRMIFSA
jgi:hypothetical protein